MKKHPIESNNTRLNFCDGENKVGDLNVVAIDICICRRVCACMSICVCAYMCLCVAVKMYVFAWSVHITQFNDTVHNSAQQRALNFAHHEKTQAFLGAGHGLAASLILRWVFNERPAALEKSWLTYRSKKTEGILSLLLCCYDMPFRVTHRGGPEYKKYSVHHGVKCKLKAWDLSDMDRDMLQGNDKQIILLQEIPQVLFIEMEKPLLEPYPGLPDKLFPMLPVDAY